MTSAPFVDVKNLRQVFDVSRPWLNRKLEGRQQEFLKAVDSVTFGIAKGETFALVGESGSGKTTVARMIVGLLRPTAGEVLIDGVSMSDVKQSHARQNLRRRIQMIFQDPYASLNPRFRVGATIAEPIRSFDLLQGERTIQDRVGELLNLVGLHPDDGRKFPHEFSGGQRQRIGIARALALNPDLIVADEPVSALDVSVQAQIINLFMDLQQQLGLTYVFVAHDLAVVRQMATRVAVMYLGSIVEIGDTGSLFRAPAHPYTAALLAAVPRLSAAMNSAPPKAVLRGEIPSATAPPPGCRFHPRCPRAEARCRQERPTLRPLSQEREVACHFPLL
jgi:peptide/nickel transport system ATP-binding protein